MRTIVGCCGWTEAHARYYKDFPSIELQTTFYEPPAVVVAARWKQQAPPGFGFCMKAWQLITHTPASPTYRRLRSVVSPSERDLYGSFRETEQVWLAWERTREIARVLEARMIVFQCPASFLPTRENIRNLTQFFQRIERDDCTLCWEPRGDAWQPALIRELCQENRLVHCVDPFKADPVHGESLYWRLHGRTGYSYRYTEEDFAELRCKLHDFAHLPGPSYLMFNNIYSKEDALHFLAATTGTSK